ncbi:hypothetical protein [Candidatus Magnetobacterium casense]|uniref:hypothetical protein n=1 Tax=Candidatus Magnetobacterium casense TaxID=1455061 RepID=UPI00058D2CA9|nr:hypothetical protein [Candidatus Magnetobacterium casensis]
MTEDIDKYHFEKGREAGMYLAGILSVIPRDLVFDVIEHMDFNPVVYLMQSQNPSLSEKSD